MCMPLFLPGIEQVTTTLQHYDLHSHSLLQLMAVALLQGPTGKHDISLFSCRVHNEVVDRTQPWAAIGVVEGETAAHLLLIRGGVEIIGIDKHPAQSLSEQLSNARLA